MYLSTQREPGQSAERLPPWLRHVHDPELPDQIRQLTGGGPHQSPLPGMTIN